MASAMSIGAKGMFPFLLRRKKNSNAMSCFVCLTLSYLKWSVFAQYLSSDAVTCFRRGWFIWTGLLFLCRIPKACTSYLATHYYSTLRSFGKEGTTTALLQTIEATRLQPWFHYSLEHRGWSKTCCISNDRYCLCHSFCVEDPDFLWSRPIFLEGPDKADTWKRGGA